MDTKPESANPSADKPRRVIKRYSNRKLYDTKDSRYVTLLQIAEMVRGGEDMQIIDNNTKDDLTEVTLAQIIYEEQKAQTRSVPLQTLRDLIHSRTEKVLENLREGPIGRLIPTPKEGEGGEAVATTPRPEPVAAAKGPSFVAQARETIEDFQHKVDERIKAILPSITPWQQLQQEVKRLTQRVEELERRLGGGSSSSDGDAPS